MAKIKISKDIEYNEEISKEDFKEFVDVLEEKDSDAHAEEGADGFVDLYNYWSEEGLRRMKVKISANKASIETNKNIENGKP